MQELFEGRRPPVAPKEEPNLPKKLCLPHQQARVANADMHPQVSITYDVDSVCLFPSSLAIAQQGLQWIAVLHPIMNITTNVHLTLLVETITNLGAIVQTQTPLHKIPYYCLREFVGFEDLFLFAFFLQLTLQENWQTTFLTTR